MQRSAVTRRRAIGMLAMTAAAAAASPHEPAASELEWNGLAMGTDARIVFCGASETAVRKAAEAIVAEIERLENALSLFRSDSEICRLNRHGMLTVSSGDFRRALKLAIAIADLTGGLFDPTVQALWEAHIDWFASSATAPLPPDDALALARTAVDWRRIQMDESLIWLRHGQRITLNGLGQGYVTDRVAGLLQAHGFAHVLVDLGEQRALGPRSHGKPWRVARAGAPVLMLTEGALATSEGSGCILGADGTAHHLFDPRTGRSADRWKRITVHHRSAAIADALSTALYAASVDEIGSIVGKMPEIAVWATDNQGREWQWGCMPT
jgi:thiamine biosynthesis lipoprotein